MINLTPLGTDHKIEIEEARYQELISRKDQGWSVTQSRDECLAKLHYLRKGLQEGKIDEPSFRERERQVVINYWKKFSLEG